MPNYIFHWKVCLFFKILCFQQPLTHYGIDFLSSTVIVTKTHGPFQMFPCGLSHSKKTTKVDETSLILCHQENSIFLKSFYSNGLLGPQKRNHDTHNVCQKTFWTVVKCCLTFYCLNNRENEAKLFSSLERLSFFFKISCFHQNPGS